MPGVPLALAVPTPLTICTLSGCACALHRAVLDTSASVLVVLRATPVMNKETATVCTSLVRNLVHDVVVSLEAAGGVERYRRATHPTVGWLFSATQSPAPKAGRRSAQP